MPSYAEVCLASHSYKRKIPSPTQNPNQVTITFHKQGEARSRGPPCQSPGPWPMGTAVVRGARARGWRRCCRRSHFAWAEAGLATAAATGAETAPDSMIGSGLGLPTPSGQMISISGIHKLSKIEIYLSYKDFQAMCCCASVRWGWQQVCSGRLRKVFENIFRCFAVICLSAVSSCELQLKVVSVTPKGSTWIRRVQGPEWGAFNVSGFGKEFGKLG